MNTEVLIEAANNFLDEVLYKWSANPLKCCATRGSIIGQTAIELNRYAIQPDPVMVGNIPLNIRVLPLCLCCKKPIASDAEKFMSKYVCSECWNPYYVKPAEEPTAYHYVVTCPNPSCDAYDYVTYWTSAEFCPICGANFVNPLKEPVDGKTLPIERQEALGQAIYEMKQVEDKYFTGLGISAKRLRESMSQWMKDTTNTSPEF